MAPIAIAGVSGYIGTRLLTHLNDVDAVQRVVGIDVKAPTVDSPKLRFYVRDVREPLGDILAENQVDSAINLAFVLRPTRDRERAQAIDVAGNLNFLMACCEAGVQHVLYLSSYAVYGAHSDDAEPLTEGAPLRPLPDFQYSWDKAENERILREYAAANASASVTVLRCCPVIGPNAADAVIALMFKPPVMIGVAGYDPPLQFLHETDLVHLITALLRQRRAGVYNVAGDGALRYSEVARIAGKKVARLPGGLLGFAMGLSWALHLQNQSPVSGLEFLKYPPLLSTAKLKRETSFEFAYSSREALLSFVSVGATHD